MIFQQILEKKSPKKRVLLHGESASLFKDNSFFRIPKEKDLIPLLRDHEKSILLLAAPFAYTNVKETVHLKQNELLQADQQILEFSRFPNQNRIVESIAVSSETALTCFTHLSDGTVELLEQINKSKLKVSWKPAISHLIQQYIKHCSEQQQDLELIMDQEILYLGCKDSKVLCKHLYFWTQEGSHEDKATRAKSLLHSGYVSSKPISIDLHRDDNKTTDCDFLCKYLLFPQKKPKQVKSVRKIVKDRKKLNFTLGHVRFAAVVTTCLMIVWTIGLNIHLTELKSERNQLIKDVQELKHSTAQLEQIAFKERSLIKTKTLVGTLKGNSIDLTNLIEQLERLLPKTSWIQSIKISHKTLQIQILDTENSNISKQLTNLGKTFGDIELVNNSNLIIDDISLRTRTFTLHFKLNP